MDERAATPQPAVRLRHFAGLTAFLGIWSLTLIHQWGALIRVHDWWAAAAPGASSAVVESDRRHLVVDAVLVTVVCAAALLLVFRAGRRASPAHACTLAGALAGLNLMLWIGALLVAGNPETVNVTCPAMEKAMTPPHGGEGGGWASHTWSWSEFGLVYAVSDGHRWSRVVCRAG